MSNSIENIHHTALSQIKDCASIDELQHVRTSLLGRKGTVTELLKNLKSVPEEQRREFGKAANTLRVQLTEALDEKQLLIMDEASSIDVNFDLSLPGRMPPPAGLHPITQMAYDLNDAFLSLGFEIFEGPEVTSELYEFDNLNFPPDHPARESMDTYWIEGYEHQHGAARLCLRPHLTGASVRYMQNTQPPFRFVYPGRVYRNEATDPRHERAFFQYEVLIVDKNIPFSSGQILVKTILDKVFGRSVDIRMRSGFFPFVEPGFEIDMRCLVCEGKGCRVCKHVGWLELMPGGAPHPNVLKAGGIDPLVWSGFYLNVGLDRLVMMRYGVDDVRLFHSGDLRFLRQFK
jgi:phenylalanyl-tRNA synthetase alpha chain